MRPTIRTAAVRLRLSVPPAVAAIAAVLAVVGCQPAQLTTTAQPAPTSTARPAASPTATQIPGQNGQLRYLWAPNPPAGMTVQASASRADATSFVLQLANPSSPGADMVVTGGTAARRPNAAPAQAVTVRFLPGSAYTSGEGWTVFWMEDGQPYEVTALLSLPQLLAAALRLQSMDLQTWRQRVGAA